MKKTLPSIAAAPGIHAKGNDIYVSVAFNEPVTVTGFPSLTTTDFRHRLRPPSTSPARAAQSRTSPATRLAPPRFFHALLTPIRPDYTKQVFDYREQQAER